MADQPTDYSSIDAFHVGRRRKPNFTDHEVLNIINQYDEYKDLLHSREASKSVIAQKQAIWKQITENLNATYPQVERTVEDVRRKWKKLQSEAKREVAAYRAAQLAGTPTPATNKQMTLYNRILSICRAPLPTSSTSHFAHAVAVAAAMHRQQAMQLQSTMNNGISSNNHETHYNEQSSDRADSPSSDLANGVSAHVDSPGDESASLLGHDDNSPSPATSHQPTSLSSFIPPLAPKSDGTTNGQVSKRTLDKQRKYLKQSRHQPYPSSMIKTSSSGQHHHSLRYESLIKRKRTLELTSQRLINDKERLLIERKNLELKFALNENENERINLEKRRTDIAIQKLQSESSNGTHSDLDDHEDNNSLDDISDINE